MKRGGVKIKIPWKAIHKVRARYKKKSFTLQSVEDLTQHLIQKTYKSSGKVQNKNGPRARRADLKKWLLILN